MTCYRHTGVVAALLIGGLIAGCSPPPSHEIPGPTPTSGETPGVSDATRIVDSVEGYELGPGDQIRLTVFQHEDLSGEYELDGEGYFTVPLLGEINANGRTTRQLERRVESELQGQGYLVNPQVSVEVLNYRPFYIIGEVNQPGSYPYVNGMNVVNAVALAGGFTQRADQEEISISRGGANGRTLEAALTSEILPGDIIEIPERFF